jgi:hypothetical protein
MANAKQFEPLFKVQQGKVNLDRSQADEPLSDRHQAD